MLNKLTVYRYYSDLSGFDMIFTIEEGDFEKAGKLIEEAIEKWFEAEDDVYFEAIGDVVTEYLDDNGIKIDIYDCTSNS